MIFNTYNFIWSGFWNQLATGVSKIVENMSKIFHDYMYDMNMYMVVSWNRGTQIIHFSRIFHDKPAILGYPHFRTPPYIYIYSHY